MFSIKFHRLPERVAMLLDQNASEGFSINMETLGCCAVVAGLIQAPIRVGVGVRVRVSYRLLIFTYLRNVNCSLPIA